MSKHVDLTGQKFGRLTALKMVGRNKYGNAMWLCICECKENSVVLGKHLRHGKTKSCGCFNRERVKESYTTHGMSDTKEYAIWTSMLQRCRNKNDKNYAYYGGRGITVSNNWLNFENFFTDMGMKPEDLTLDRIDNNLGYYKENCHWISMAAQAKNKSIYKTNKSGIEGVFWDKTRSRYTVRIGVNYKNYFVGYFKTFSEAKEARSQAEQKYWRSIK